MKLQRLANLEAIKVNKEFDENAVEIDRLGNILGSQEEINKLLIATLREVAAKFGDARRTQLMNLSEQVEEIEEEQEMLQSVTVVAVQKEKPQRTISHRRR
jgi:DNA gyrase/topoisomerase IV subunit A